METIIKTKFFTFSQNNSGGYFIDNDYVSRYLIIEDINIDEAIRRMHMITRDYSDYCSCCGRRWRDYAQDDNGSDIPMIWDEEIEPLGNVIVYYYNGTRKKI